MHIIITNAVDSLNVQKDMLHAGYSWKHGNPNEPLHFSFQGMDDIIIHYDIMDMYMTWERTYDSVKGLKLALEFAKLRVYG